MKEFYSFLCSISALKAQATSSLYLGSDYACLLYPQPPFHLNPLVAPNPTISMFIKINNSIRSMMEVNSLSLGPHINSSASNPLPVPLAVLNIPELSHPLAFIQNPLF